MISSLRDLISESLWMRTVRKHRSRMGWREAPRYTQYLERARRGFTLNVDAKTGERAAHFRAHGWASFSGGEETELARSMLGKLKAEEASGQTVWDGDGRYLLGDIYVKFPEVESFFRGAVGDFLRATYGSNFKIFYGVCYHSAHMPNGPAGSQLWHADGGPGTCINLMWCLSPVSAENGAMECLSWGDTVKIFEGERKAVRQAFANEADRAGRRKALTAYYKMAIDNHMRSRINQPTGEEGLVFAFSNNVIHKGGYPAPGKERYVCVFHIYPSAIATPFDRYKSHGISKSASNPSDPAFGDVS